MFFLITVSIEAAFRVLMFKELEKKVTRLLQVLFLYLFILIMIYLSLKKKLQF